MKAGPGISRFFGSASMKEYTSSLLIRTAGVQFQYQFSSQWWLNSELCYALTGTQINGIKYYSDQTFIGSSRVRIHLNYLNIPILLRYEFGKSQRFFIYAGPSFSFLMGMKNKVLYHAEPGSKNVFPDAIQVNHFYPAEYKNYNLGVTFGAGVQFPVCEKAHLSLELRSTAGLTSINPNNNSEKSRTESTYLLFGYQYRLARN